MYLLLFIQYLYSGVQVSETTSENVRFSFSNRFYFINKLYQQLESESKQCEIFT